ncbi:hypothetical protein V2I78_14935, partial [Pseudomonas viridiflava]|uniref:hypothetical protein n=1 Tax=Pseudomonas viridiflava TaxID=33069 RepID=UPI002EA83B97|nr:hypothetical protein [Pseudomonas viridiflava]
GDERLRDFPDTPRRLHRRQAASHKKLFHSADYVLFDKRWLAGDLPGTGSKTCTRGASNTTWAAAQPIAAVVTSESSNALRAEADFSASSQGFAVDQRAIT